MDLIRKTHLLLREIGLSSLASYANYAFRKKLGLFQSSNITRKKDFSAHFSIDELTQPDLLTLKGISSFPVIPLGSADEIVAGFSHPFGGDNARLDFSLPQPLQDWTTYSDLVDGVDIKKIWEPARFCWSLILAQSYMSTKNESYIETFWKNFKEFNNSNPPYLGPNWVSAQEVALRAINWLLILPVLKSAACTTKAQLDNLVNSIWQHFLRLPPTVAYAKSQNNNHLLSESLGIFLLGSFFESKSKLARKSRKDGESLFEHTLLAQIDADGTYCQHSTNYHRMMLHLALIYSTAKKAKGKSLPDPVMQRLQSATIWLNDLLDIQSGRVPNLGHNDGTLLLPFGCQDYNDYRPTLQAASLAFLDCRALPAGSWDELAQILTLQPSNEIEKKVVITSPASHRLGNENLWASLRAVHFNGRPAHADQLHTEIWWQGVNIAQDAGTYAYNDAPPWQNPLMATRVHNTISVNFMDQMQRAGKFLWLDWAQAALVVTPVNGTISACHDGYRALGIRHSRSISFQNDSEIIVEDLVDLKHSTPSHLVCLHWLLPDWEWNQHEGSFIIQHKNQKVELSIACRTGAALIPLLPDDIALMRAGQSLLGNTRDEVMGWVSPTYGVKIPALAYTTSWRSSQSLVIISTWHFSKAD